jgi:hypothetical protein
MPLNDNMQSLKSSLVALAVEGHGRGYLLKLARRQERQIESWRRHNADGRHDEVIRNMTDTLNSYRDALARA